MQQTNKPRRQAGAALIVAILITAVIATLSSVVIYQERLRINQSTELLALDKVRLGMHDIEVQAGALLASQVSASGNPQGIPLQLTVPITTSDSSSMKQQAILEDQQGLFNINLLNDNKNNVYFERLLQTVVPEFTASQALTLTTTIANYEKAIKGGVGQANLLLSINELLSVEGVDKKIYNAIAPYLSALPDKDAKINANTAKPAILSAIYPQLSSAQIDSLVACRQQIGPVQSASDWQQGCGITISNTSSGPPVVFQSQYYQLRAVLTVDDDVFLLQSMMSVEKGENQNAPYQVNYLWQVDL